MSNYKEVIIIKSSKNNFFIVSDNKKVKLNKCYAIGTAVGITYVGKLIKINTDSLLIEEYKSNREVKIILDDMIYVSELLAIGFFLE